MKKSITALSLPLGLAVLALGLAFPAHAAESSPSESAQDSLWLPKPVSAVLQKILAENLMISSETEEDPGLDCQDAPPPGGWTSFPLACRRFVGQMEVATDSGFHHVIMTFGIEQQGRLTRNSSGEIEYRFFLKLGALRMKPEKVVWQSDRSYQIGDKISGRCDLGSAAGSPAVVCRASFHGILATIAGGYVETYYGPELTRIDLRSADSQDGHSPLLHWRASLTEAN
jgi:hypothetical protein